MARAGTILLLLLAALTAYAGEISGTISDITADYGNIDTDIGYQQLEEFGFQAGDSFVIVHGGQRITAEFGTSYGDVPRGEWVGLINGMGNLRLARNFENAAETLGAKIGDEIAITAVTTTISK